MPFAAPVSDHAHDALEEVLADDLGELGRTHVAAVAEYGHAALAQAHLVELFHHELGVGNVGGQHEEDVGLCVPHLLHERGRVGQRRGVDLVHDELQPQLVEAALAHRLGECHGGGGIVHDDADSLRLHPTRLLGDLHEHRQRVLGLLARRRRGLEDVLVAARRDLVRIGESQPRHLGALGDLGDRQCERAHERAGPADQIRLLRQQALRRVLRFFCAVAGIGDDQLHLRAAERLDPAGGVDVVHRELRSFDMQLAVARPGAGERHDHGHLHLFGLRARRRGPKPGRCTDPCRRHGKHEGPAP